MPIAFDNVSSVQATNVSSVTIPAFTVGGTDRLIFVGVGSSDVGQLTSSVVRNAAPSETFTEKWDVTRDFGGGAILHCSGHYFIAPATGSFSITVTVAGIDDGVAAGAISFTGVDQTTGLGTQGTANGTSTTASVTVTAGTNDWLVDTTYVDAVTIVAGADQTSRWEEENIGAFSAGGGSTQLGSANDVMSWDLVASGNWIIGAVPVLAPAAAGSVVTPRLLGLLGVGA